MEDTSNYSDNRGILLLSIQEKILVRMILDRLSYRNVEAEHRYVCSNHWSDEGLLYNQSRWASEGPLKTELPTTASHDLHTVYAGQMSEVKYSGKLQILHYKDSGMIQECVLTPIPFATFFNMVLKEAKKDLTKGSVFNIYRLHACLRQKSSLSWTCCWQITVQCYPHAEDIQRVMLNDLQKFPGHLSSSSED